MTTRTPIVRRLHVARAKRRLWRRADDSGLAAAGQVIWSSDGPGRVPRGTPGADAVSPDDRVPRGTPGASGGGAGTWSHPRGTRASASSSPGGPVEGESRCGAVGGIPPSRVEPARHSSARAVSADEVFRLENPDGNRGYRAVPASPLTPGGYARARAAEPMGPCPVPLPAGLSPSTARLGARRVAATGPAGHSCRPRLSGGADVRVRARVDEAGPGPGVRTSAPSRPLNAPRCPWCRHIVPGPGCRSSFWTA